MGGGAVRARAEEHEQGGGAADGGNPRVPVKVGVEGWAVVDQVAML